MSYVSKSVLRKLLESLNWSDPHMWSTLALCPHRPSLQIWILILKSKAIFLRLISCLDSMNLKDYELKTYPFKWTFNRKTWLVSLNSNYSVANFVKQFDSLEDKALQQQYKGFTLCKPGFVELFRTLKTCHDYVHRLKHLYMAFDDEYNTISRVVNQTKLMIKSFYRHFYAKLTLNWRYKLKDINHNYVMYCMCSLFTSFH